MIKNKIIMTASVLYSIHGIKVISPKNIAKELNISEDIIHDLFINQEALLLEIITFESNNLLRYIKEIEKETNSSLEILLKICINFFRGLSTLGPHFYKDLRNFPQAYDYFLLQIYKFKTICSFYLKKGAKEGTFLPNKNYENIASILVEEISKLELKYQYNNIVAFLMGICTKKGVIELVISLKIYYYDNNNNYKEYIQ